MDRSALSESIEMYLKTLAGLGGGEAPVPIARLADRLGVTSVSANEMMQRLAKEALVTHTPYKGVALTPGGRRQAYSVIRRQRLWECFLVDYLKLDWARVSGWACQLEHATPPEVTDALEAFIGYPATCPHGRPIPNAAGEVNVSTGIPLDALPIGQPGRILAIHEDSPDVLEYLQRRGLVPGQIVTVTEAAPRQGPLTLQLGDTESFVGIDLATLVTVEPLPQ